MSNNKVADLTLDPASRVVKRGERTLALTRTEFEILAVLMRHAGTVLDRATLYSEVWGFDFETSSKSLDAHARYIRRKLEENGEPRLLHTIHGVGYALREPAEQP